MRLTRIAPALLSSAVLLAGCGGSSDSTPQFNQTRVLGGAVRGGVVAHAPEAYRTVVQQVYLAYFGRPADVAGLKFWMQIFSDRGLPLQVADLAAAYGSNPQVKQVIDVFVNSEESQGLYTGSNAAFINSVYRNLFNRNAEAEGLTFWSGFLERKTLTRGQIVLSIAAGAQNDDRVVEDKKTKVAQDFQNLLQLAGATAILSYDGDRVNQAARELLGMIAATTDTAVFQEQSLQLINDMQLIPGGLPVVRRYSGFNDLQDMSEAGPTYAAYFKDLRPYGGAPSNVTRAASGTMTWGVLPQTTTWSRDTAAVFSFGAPFASNYGIRQSTTSPGDPYPAFVMLCRENGKSTDLLVSNALSPVTKASELANQTINVYRENCGAANSNVKAYAFDANGAATVTLSNGISTYNVEAVNQILRGQVLPDLASGSYITLKFYRYTKTDGHDGFVIVQHQAQSLSKLSSGVLGLWAQE